MGDGRPPQGSAKAPDGTIVELRRVCAPFDIPDENSNSRHHYQETDRDLETTQRKPQWMGSVPHFCSSPRLRLSLVRKDS